MKTRARFKTTTGAIAVASIAAVFGAGRLWTSHGPYLPGSPEPAAGTGVAHGSGHGHRASDEMVLAARSGRGRAAAIDVREKLEKLHALVGTIRREWEKKASHAAWANSPDGDMELRWFVDFDGTVVPEDDEARNRARYPSAFLAMVYDRRGRILATLQRSEAGAEDVYSQDDLLFDSRGRTIGYRHSYLSYVDCGLSQVERVAVTVFDASGKVVARTEALDADGAHTLPAGCVLADKEREVPPSAVAALRLYGLDERWVRSQPHPR